MLSKFIVSLALVSSMSAFAAAPKIACLGSYATDVGNFMKGEGSHENVTLLDGQATGKHHSIELIDGKISVTDLVTKKSSVATNVDLIDLDAGELFVMTEVVNGPEEIEWCGSIPECHEEGKKVYLFVTCMNGEEYRNEVKEVADYNLSN